MEQRGPSLPPRGAFERALDFAARLHRGQTRKGSRIPYVTHLLSVAALVGEHGGDEEQMIAALLHDGPEDQGGAAVLAEIRRRFGDRVARIVEACTDTLESPKPPWKERKAAYLARLARIPPEARLVSAADKVHNLRTLVSDLRREGERVWRRFHAPRADQLWYYRSLTREFRRGGPAALAEEMERLLAEIGGIPRRSMARPPGARRRPGAAFSGS